MLADMCGIYGYRDRDGRSPSDDTVNRTLTSAASSDLDNSSLGEIWLFKTDGFVKLLAFEVWFEILFPRGE